MESGSWGQRIACGHWTPRYKLTLKLRCVVSVWMLKSSKRPKSDFIKFMIWSRNQFLIWMIFKSIFKISLLFSDILNILNNCCHLCSRQQCNKGKAVFKNWLPRTIWCCFMIFTFFNVLACDNTTYQFCSIIYTVQ